MTTTIPLFPIKRVLFPFTAMVLKVFETRYRDMVSDCLRQQKDFGVVLIKSGSEHMQISNPRKPELYDIGTLASIIDVDSFEDSSLAITIMGQNKFRLLESTLEQNNLISGEIEELEEEPFVEVSEKLFAIKKLLSKLQQSKHLPPCFDCIDFKDTRHVGGLLVQALPFNQEDQFKLLMLDNPLKRLEIIDSLVSKTNIA